MDENRKGFSEEELRGAIDSREAEAKRILEDEGKVKQLLGKAKKIIGKIRNAPVIGALVDDLLTLFDLIGDYAKGNYKKIPVRVIISAVAGVVYLVSPIDIIPDFIPVAGWLDDAAVLTLILNAGLASELGKYNKWRLENKKNGFSFELQSKISARIADKCLAAMFLTDENNLKLLLTKQSEEYALPLDVKPVILKFDYTELKVISHGLNICAFDVLDDIRVKISYPKDYDVKVCRESDFADFDEYFEIEVEDD